MEIFICTHGRQTRQITYQNLPREIREKTTLVIQHSEVQWWKPYWMDYDFLILPPHIKNLPDTREWLQHNTGPKIVMMDDDLVFSVRRDDEPTKFRPPQAGDLEAMFADIERQLDTYAHVGVSHREGANRRTEDYIEVSRMMRVLAYRTDVVTAEGVISNRTPDVEDFDVTLQLLRKGYPNRLLNKYVHNQSGSDQSGGCSGYRTPETHDRDVRIFAAAHEPFVKVVKKKTKDRWCADKNGERTDVTVYWKKAFASAEGVKNVPTIES